MEDICSVLQFWFGDAADNAATAQRQAPLWWGKDQAADDLIRTRFSASLENAAANGLADWTESAEGMLALIILLDQFPRNIHRATPQAFAYDELARQCCHLGLAQGFDQQLPPLQRVFFYLPLEHAEDADDQDYSLQLFRKLKQDAPAADKTLFDGYLTFAAQHHAIIARFGRFPHRNAILDRPTTPEEAQFLLEPHSSF